MNKKYYLGIDIGTYESKGVLVDIKGKIIAQSSKKHELIVPQKGWAEHRPLEDWWNDFIYICNDLIKLSNCDSNLPNQSTCSFSTFCLTFFPAHLSLIGKKKKLSAKLKRRERETTTGIQRINCPMTPFVTSMGIKAAMVVKAVAVMGSHKVRTDSLAAS